MTGDTETGWWCDSLYVHNKGYQEAFNSTHPLRLISCTVTSSLLHCQNAWSESVHCHGTTPRFQFSGPCIYKKVLWKDLILGIKYIHYFISYHKSINCTFFHYICNPMLETFLTWTCGRGRIPSHAPSCCSGYRSCRCRVYSPYTAVCCSPGI